MDPVLSFELPEISEGFALFETAAWNASYRISRGDYHRALLGSWAVLTARVEGRLVGLGRLVSDGVLYALLVDVIVHPEHQRSGLGQAIVKSLVERCRAAGLRSLQLFAAEGTEAFYRQLGFRPRRQGCPGMELSLNREA